MTIKIVRKSSFPTGMIFLLLAVILMISCRQSQDSDKAADRFAFKAPVAKPLKYTEAKKIEWEIVPSDSIPPPQTYSLDIDKLPSTPLVTSVFKPMKAPMKEYAFNFEDLPENVFQLDTIPMAFRKAIIPKPVVTKMDQPRRVPELHHAILQLSKTEGLPSDEIKEIMENEDGTYWIATYEGGLSLYNGESINTYNYDQIFNIAKDQEGRLWLGTADGMVVLDFENNIETSFFRGNAITDVYCDHNNKIWWIHWLNGLYTMKSDMTELHKVANEGFNRPIRILEDSANNLWIGIAGNDLHISVISPDRKSFKDIHGTAEYNIGFVAKLFEDSKGTIWIDALQQEPLILGFNLKEKTAKTLNKENGYHGFGRLFEEDDRGRLWIFQRDSVYVLSADQNQLRSFATLGIPASNNRMGYVIKDKQGVLWLGTHNRGVELIDPNSPLIESLDADNGLNNPDVWSVEETSRGDIWLGSNGNIDVLNRKQETVKRLNNQQLKHRRPGAIYKIEEFEKDNIFISGAGGFSVFDRGQNSVTYYSLETSLNTTIRDFVVDENNLFWLATNTDGILVYDTARSTIKKLSIDGALVPPTTSNKIIEDGNGNYWAIANDGIIIINKEENTLRRIGVSEGLINNDVTNILLRNNTELWVATSEGLSVIDITSQTITNLGKEEGIIPPVLYELNQRDGIVYLGSSEGLIEVKPPAEKSDPWLYYKYGVEQGFGANDYSANASTLLKNGELWFPGATPDLQINIIAPDVIVDTTSMKTQITGISIMDQDQSFDSYTKYETLLSENDTLWEAGKDKYFLKSTLPSDTGYVFENNIQWDSLPVPFKLPLGLKLPYDQNYLRFQYANFRVLNRDKIAFRYILEGYDSKWNYPGSKSVSKNYFNLPPGKYTFQVETRELSGKWGSQAHYTFSILPPWWQTWWAYLLYAIIVIGGIWSIVQYRSRQLKRKNRLLEEKVAFRTKELQKTITSLKSTQAQLIQSEKMASLGELTAGIAHEIQNPLNFVNNFSEVNRELIEELKEEKAKTKKERDEKLEEELLTDIDQNLEKISHHGKRADSIVKGMLQHSRASSGEKEPTDINMLADEYLRLAYHGLRAKDKSFNATLDTDFDKDIGKIDIIPQDMGRVILNLITNAFHAVQERKKRGEKGYEPTVTVSTKTIGDTIQVAVKDNGNGVPQQIIKRIFEPFFTTKPSGRGTGLGLSMSYEIVTKGHGGELKVTSKEGEGTIFTIILPGVKENKTKK